MPSLKIIYGFLLIVISALIVAGCGGDKAATPEPTPEPPDPPAGIFGTPMNFDTDYEMVLLWADHSGGKTGTYNIYRTIDNGAVEKLNDSPIGASSFGPGAYYPSVLWFADSTYDTASSSLYIYFIKTINAAGESVSSDSVACVPNTISLIDDPAAGLSPDNEETLVTTSFSWREANGFSSYLLMLMNDEDYHMYWPWWIYRTADTTCALHAASGITYLDTLGVDLESDHGYAWTVWAVSDYNCGLQRSAATFKTLDPDFLLTFINGTMSAGRYRICWNQTNLYGLQVVPGIYQVRMTAGGFDTTINFDIVAPGDPVGPAEVQDCDEDFSGLLPASYTLGLNAVDYGVGDTIKITYDLPVTGNVKIEIGR